VSGVLARWALLSHLVAGLLALGRRHLAPALSVPLEALALIRAHGLVALESLPDLLLLLLRKPLKAVVRRFELTLALLR
jgi:hypothetical protein